MSTLTRWWRRGELGDCVDGDAEVLISRGDGGLNHSSEQFTVFLSYARDDDEAFVERLGAIYGRRVLCLRSIPTRRSQRDSACAEAAEH